MIRLRRKKEKNKTLDQSYKNIETTVKKKIKKK